MPPPSAFLSPLPLPLPSRPTPTLTSRFAPSTTTAHPLPPHPHTPHPARLHRTPISASASADFYQTLGISRSASEAEIKAGFRAKARKLHPDVNKASDAKERFQEVSRAYEVLSDVETRQRYDQFGEAGLKGNPGFSSDFGGQDFGSFSDIFDTFFGGTQQKSRRRTGPQPGDDLRLDVDVPFERAVFGGEQKIRFSHLENCTTCKGNGVKPGTSPRGCGTCDGSGTVTQVVRTPLGMFQQTGTCTTCRGTGEVVDEYCPSCGGRGRNQTTKQLMITVPPGVDTGSRLRVRNEGDAGPKGGPSGDLYVMLRVKESPDFTRDGTNLYSTINISYLDAILGKQISVKTVDGFVDLNIQSGTQPAAVQRIDGKGVPKLGNGSVRGDHFITVQVKIPTRLTAEERALVSQLDLLTGGAARANGKAAKVPSEKGSKKSKKGEGFFNFGKK